MLSLELLNSFELVNDDGDLIRYEDYWDHLRNEPISRQYVVKRQYVKVQPEVELERYQTTSWTGATIEVRKWRDRFGKVQTDEKVIRLNNGDDDDCPPDNRWGILMNTTNKSHSGVALVDEATRKADAGAVDALIAAVRDAQAVRDSTREPLPASVMGAMWLALERIDAARAALAANAGTSRTNPPAEHKPVALVDLYAMSNVFIIEYAVKTEAGHTIVRRPLRDFEQWKENASATPPRMFNGLTEAETSATASVAGLATPSRTDPPAEAREPVVRDDLCGRVFGYQWADAALSVREQMRKRLADALAQPRDTPRTDPPADGREAAIARLVEAVADVYGDPEPCVDDENASDDPCSPDCMSCRIRRALAEVVSTPPPQPTQPEGVAKDKPQKLNAADKAVIFGKGSPY